MNDVTHEMAVNVVIISFEVLPRNTHGTVYQFATDDFVCGMPYNYIR